MGQGCKVTRSANRPLRGDDRRQTLPQHCFKQRNSLRANTGGALRKACELQGHHEARDRHRHRIAHARGMAQDDIALKDFKVIVINLDRRELAEPCVDSIDWNLLCQNAGHSGGARGDARAARWIKHRTCASIDRAPIAQRNIAWHRHDSHCPLQIRA
jgi:hypothetical protein